MNAPDGLALPGNDCVQRLARHWVLGLAIALTLVACDRINPPAATIVVDPQSNPETSWAAAALSRNPNIDVLATDATAGVFTVRMKSSGEVRALKLSELAAAPISELARAQSVAMIASTESAPAAVAPAIESRSAPAVEKPPTTSIVPETSVAASTPAAPPGTSAAEEPAKSYTIERAGGQVKVSGPGVSIVSSNATAVAGGTSTGQRNADPIVCEGNRMLHLDNRVIDAEGTAVIARGGCELYITNSRIKASGTGVVIQDAIVHIANSTIEGSAASFDADDRARMFVRSSTFRGVPRRGEKAVIQDQGGNQWR